MITLIVVVQGKYNTYNALQWDVYLTVFFVLVYFKQNDIALLPQLIYTIPFWKLD